MTQKKQEDIEKISLAVIMVLLGVFIAATIIHVGTGKGTAKVINYSGIVRGGTQRLVKLEIAGCHSDALIERTDNILFGLEHGGTAYELERIPDKTFRRQLSLLESMWQSLKHEIYIARDSGWENSNILSLSEDFFTQADETVYAAEKYSDRIYFAIHLSETGMVLLVLLSIIITSRRFIITMKMSKQNSALSRKAYIDSHTGLPNKNKCEELLNDSDFLDNKTTVIMMDLNNLKKVNDSLGHVAGDSMIMNFAHIIRTAVPGCDFVGRYGGDEFIAILYDSDIEEGKLVIEAANQLVEKFNMESGCVKLSFAAGYAHSSQMTSCTLKTLLEQADEAMYHNKQAMKAGR